MCSRFPHLTLQVVRANVAAHKRVKYADPFVKQLSHLDVVVSVHACHSSNTLIAAAVDLLPQTDASGRVGLQLFDSPQVETVAAAVDAIKVWKRDSILASYAPKFLPGFPDHIRSAAGALVSDMARHGQSRIPRGNLRTTLRTLRMACVSNWKPLSIYKTQVSFRRSFAMTTTVLGSLTSLRWLIATYN